MDRTPGPADRLTPSLLDRLFDVDQGGSAAALKPYASPEKANEIDEACKRLLGETRTGMGKLFKAIAISHPDLSPMPGFE